MGVVVLGFAFVQQSWAPQQNLGNGRATGDGINGSFHDRAV